MTAKALHALFLRRLSPRPDDMGSVPVVEDLVAEVALELPLSGVSGPEILSSNRS
jgi:hypothetical protein